MKIEEQINRLTYYYNTTLLAEQAEDGTLETFQNWSYFWYAAFEQRYFITFI